MRASLSLTLVVALWGCSGEKQSAQRIAAYESTDSCSSHTDEASCSADTASGCAWIALGAPCPAGTDCPGGVCQAPDPCRAHGDLSSCEADPACAWAAVELCPPPGDSCPDGFCYTKTDGCACVCPLYCPAGEECPPCECDCPPDGGGGDDCTCVCPDCAEGETCPPCDCTCDGGDGGGCGGGTCTCACPACEPGTECAPCECTCEDAPVSTGTAAPVYADPCAEHTDESSCWADTANACTWYAIGAPCIEGEPCVSGVCQGPGSGGGGGGGGGCGCVCPTCVEGETCPPCDCSETPPAP